MDDKGIKILTVLFSGLFRLGRWVIGAIVTTVLLVAIALLSLCEADAALPVITLVGAVI